MPRSAPPNNGNAEKHSLYADRDKLYNRLSDDEKRIVVAIAEDLLDRYEDDVGAYEREAIRNIAVDTVKRIRANEYIVSEDLVTDASKTSERANTIYDRLVRSTTSELEKLGLLREGPALKQAEATQGWMDAISEAQKAQSEAEESGESEYPWDEE